MHRSRIGVVLIDHPQPDWQHGLSFWAGVQGVAVPGEHDRYRSLGSIGDVALEMQRTGEGTEPRIHLDIETDDVEAEIARVIALGATIMSRHDTWAVMRDPAGLPFCVVPHHTGEAFDRDAQTWP